MTLLAVEDLRIAFPGAEGPAVDGVGFTLERGETLALVGESGSGKSLTCLSLLDLLPPGARLLSGRARLDGRELLGGGARRLRGRDIGVVFQDPMTALNPFLTIGRQLEEPLRLHARLGRREARRRACAALEEVGIDRPAERLAQYPHEFSGGMRQRVMIAMALINRPRLLIADEPTTALDVTIQAQILELIARLQREHRLAVLFVTHDLAVAAQVARRVLVMHRGRIVEAGEVARVFTAPEADYTRRLIEAIPSRSKPYPSRADGRALLEVEDLRVDYDTAAGAFERRRRFTAVDGVSLRIEGGEVLGLVGESGSGKSTLARAVMRLLRPEAGRIRLAGNDITTLGERALRPLRRRWQMVFQDPYASLNPRLSVAEALCEPLRVHGLVETAGAARKRAARLLEEVGLPAAALDRYPHEFSGGQRQRLAIARALALEPALLVADEPVSALDVTVQAQILELLQRLNRERGLSLLFISHDLAVVRFLADRVAVMHRGRLVEQGPTERVYDRPEHPYTRRLLASVPRPPVSGHGPAPP